jgi:cAMP-dependent protein kinase regulator
MIKPDDYFEKNLKNILQPLFLSILSNKPNDIVLYSIEWLCKKGNYTKEGLTLEQKEEFTKLKQNNSSINIYESSNDDDEENINNNEINFYPKNIHRKGICGEMNKTNKQLKIYYKPEKQRDFIKSSLLYSFLFSSLDLNDLNIIIDAMDEIIFYKNENIILEGDFGNCLYLIEEGELECYKKFTTIKDNKKTIIEKLVKIYSPSEIFGELSLLYNSPRAATVKVKSEKSKLWKLDRETFNYIVRDRAIKRRKRYEKFLNNVEIFSTMDPYEISQICDALISLTYNKGEYVIKEGEISDNFYIIEDGTAQALKKFDDGTFMVKEYKIGDYFGELALMKNKPRAASIIATSEILKVVALNQNSFKRLLGPIEDILKRNSKKYMKFLPKK